MKHRDGYAYKRFGRFGRVLLLVALTALLLACASRQSLAPVKDFWGTPTLKQHHYVVRSGDTLYSIAWHFGLDYRSLAYINHIKPPYDLARGQRIVITRPRGQVRYTPIKIIATIPREKHAINKPARRYEISKKVKAPIPHKWRASKYKHKALVHKPKSHKRASHKHVVHKHKYRSHKSRRIVHKHKRHVQYHYVSRLRRVRHWRWPAKGKIGQYFALPLHKGINIRGHYGQAILAAANGKVVYAGNGLRGYGKLIILKNSSDYLSAYAYNQRILVHDGQFVRAGQKIATMGYDEAANKNQRRPTLHFEIRRRGKPVNPLRYLPFKI